MISLPAFKTIIKAPVFYLLLGFLYLLPFLNGGTGFWAQILLFLLPLPLLLLGLNPKSLNFGNLPRKVVWLWLALLGCLLISTITSTSQLFSIPEFFRYLAYFLFFALFLLTAGEGSLKVISALLLLVSFTLSLCSFLFFIPGMEKPLSGMNLVYATYGHSHLADCLLLVIPLVFSFFLAAEDKKGTIFWGLATVFYLSVFVLTFSRGAFVVLSVVIFFLLILVKPRTLVKKAVGWLPVLLPIVLFGAILGLSRQSFWQKQKFSQPDRWFIKQVIKPDFDANRIEYWREATGGFLARPLFGFGPGTFEIVALRFQKQTFGWSNYAHNFYLQLLTEGGIFSFLTFVGLLVFSFWKIIPLALKNRQNPLLVGALGGVLASTLHSLLDYDWHFPAVFLSFWLLLAVLLNYSLPKEQRPFPNSLKMLLFGLALISFVFGQTLILGKYFYSKKKFSQSLFVSPWPPTQARMAGGQVFKEDFAKGKEVSRLILRLSTQDPSIYSWLGREFLSRGELEKAREFYQKAILYNPLGNWRLWPQLIALNSQLGKDENEKLRGFLAEKVSHANKLESFGSSFNKMIYGFGLDCLKQGREEEALFWWTKAKEVLPEWSYFHLELASLYRQLGQKEKAQAVLEDCLKFKFPRLHCEEKIKEGIEGLEFPGFWSEKISTIPDY